MITVATTTIVVGDDDGNSDDDQDCETIRGDNDNSGDGNELTIIRVVWINDNSDH